MSHSLTKQNKLEIQAVIARMKNAYSMSSTELCKALDVAPSTIERWISECAIPYDMIEKCYESTNVSMDWLVFGERPSIKVTPDKLALMEQVFTRVLEDSIEYELIKQQYPGAVDELIEAYRKSIRTWAGYKNKP